MCVCVYCSCPGGADLVVVEGLQADGTEVVLCGLVWLTPGLGLAVRPGLQGRQPLQDVLLRKQLQGRAEVRTWSDELSGSPLPHQCHLMWENKPVVPTLPVTPD